MLTDVIVIAGLTALIMISPGPDLALVARNTVSDGRAAGAWTSAGILSGNLVHISYCLLGIGWLIANSVVAFTALKLAGGAYLVYLGVQSFRSPRQHDPEVRVRPGRHWWLQGVLNNLLNPKGALFYLGIFSVFVQPHHSAVQVALLVATMVCVSTLFWVMFVYVLQISMIRTRLLRAGRWVGRILGGVLIALGIRLWLSDGPIQS